MKTWTSKAGPIVFFSDTKETICYVGVGVPNQFFKMNRANLLRDRPEVKTIVPGVEFSGVLSTPELPTEYRGLWWFGFVPDSTMKLTDTERMAENLARFLAQ